MVHVQKQGVSAILLRPEMTVSIVNIFLRVASDVCSCWISKLVFCMKSTVPLDSNFLAFSLKIKLKCKIGSEKRGVQKKC